MANIDIVKRHPLLFTLPVITLIIVSSLYIVSVSNEPSGITALEQQGNAYNLAISWNASAHLIGVRVDKINNAGYSEGISYTYTNSTLGQIPINCYEIQYYKNLSYEVKSYTWFSPNNEDSPINNWTIDSNDAYNIAKNNQEISQFLSHSPTNDGFSLSASSGKPVWYIQWAYDAGFDDPHWAQIQINATTGEVLYVDADN